jgi:large subunit ribosomal protein L3
VTTGNLEIIEVRGQENLLLIKGSLPGANGGLLIVKASKKGARK